MKYPDLKVHVLKQRIEYLQTLLSNNATRTAKLKFPESLQKTLQEELDQRQIQLNLNEATSV